MLNQLISIFGGTRLPLEPKQRLLFQQDGAPTQNWKLLLIKCFLGRISAPSCPDLVLCDFLRGAISKNQFITIDNTYIHRYLSPEDSTPT